MWPSLDRLHFLQVRDLERSAALYDSTGAEALGRKPPHAVVFDTKPIAFAVRDVVAGPTWTRSRSRAREWRCGCAPTQDIHDASPPLERRSSQRRRWPFGRTFTFADPDGYQVTLDDRG